MLATDLIKLLEKEIEEHKLVEDEMGPLAVHIDTFRRCDGSLSTYQYLEITEDIKLERSPDGVYLIFNAIADA